jgi:hypothetical protein
MKSRRTITFIILGVFVLIVVGAVICSQQISDSLGLRSKAVDSMRKGEARYEKTGAYTAPIELDLISSLNVKPRLFVKATNEFNIVNNMVLSDDCDYAAVEKHCSNALELCAIELQQKPQAALPDSAKVAEMKEEVLTSKDLEGEKQLQHDELCAKLYRIRGNCLLHQRKYKVGIADLSRSIAYHIKKVDMISYEDRAKAYDALGMKKEAATDRATLNLIMTKNTDGKRQYDDKERSVNNVYIN